MLLVYLNLFPNTFLEGYLPGIEIFEDNHDPLFFDKTYTYIYKVPLHEPFNFSTESASTKR